MRVSFKNEPIRQEHGPQPQKYKFSWMELITNRNTGETSATGFCGMILTIVPLLMFCVLIVWYFFNMTHFTEISEILDKLQVLIMIGSGLLGLRKAAATFANKSFSLGKDKEETEQPQ